MALQTGTKLHLRVILRLFNDKKNKAGLLNSCLKTAKANLLKANRPAVYKNANWKPTTTIFV